MLSLSTWGAKATGTISRLVGQFGSSGPTGGPWKAGDIAPGSRGSLWVCTSDGTPGTWVLVGRSTVFDIRDYGAVIDGTTDDTSAWTAAIAAAQAVLTPGVKAQNGSGTFQAGSQVDGAGIVWHPGGVSVISNIVMGHRCVIAGAGWGSVIRQKASSTGPVITNRFDGTKHAKYCTIRDVAIDGNRANQSSSTNHGIYWQGDQTFTFNSTLDEDWDENNSVENVYIWNVKGDGIKTLGSGENRIHNVKIRGADANGLNIDFDNYITHVTVGHTGLAGVLVNGSDNRFTGVKTWYSGEVTPASGQGWLLLSDSGAMAGCSAQDCTAAGLQVGTTADGAFGWSIAGFMVDRCSKGSAGTYAQVKVQNGSNNNIEASVRNDFGGTPSGTVALDIDSASQQNRIVLNPGTGSWGTSTLLKSGSAVSGNYIAFGAEDGWREVAYAATITPNILLGSDIRIGTLTGNVTIANPTWKFEGARMRLRLKQDATGSRTLTMGSDFDSSTGHGIAINSAANSITTLAFRYSATSSKWELWT